MAVDASRLKHGMSKYAKKHGLDIPEGFDADSDGWGEPAKTLAWRVTGHLGWKQSTSKSVVLFKAMRSFMPPEEKFTIKHDYDAVHHSQNRYGNVIKWLVVHDMEDTDADDAAEDTGRWFEQLASGGSTNYGIDNDSIQQYLGDMVIPWGAPGANTNGLHVEQMGRATWTTAEWKKKAAGTLERMAWLMAKKCKEHDIPLRFVDATGLRQGKRGVTDHHECTKAFGGSHTDPGSGYPMGYVIGLAKKLS